jgi:hypothetical protein
MGTPIETLKQNRRSTSRSFPSVAEVYADNIRALVASHRKVKGQILHLALWYKTNDRKNLYLLEIVDGFPHGNGDSELFTVEFAGSDRFPIRRQGKLYLTLVNPEEAITAFEESWRGTHEIRSSLKRGDFIVLFHDKHGKQLLDQLR